MIPKFRAWDKEIKMMIEISLIDFEKHVIRGTHWKFGETESIKFNDIALMQSTGRRDKKGKGIFDGDILEIQGIRMIVKFGSYKYLETSKNNGHILGILHDGLGFYVECINVAVPDNISPFEPETLKNSQIIGNIYENPEFLEDGK